MMSLSNPLNIILIPPIIYLIYRAIFPSPPQRLVSIPTTYSSDVYNWLPAKHPHVLCYKEYSSRELAPYDGVKDERILLAIMRVPKDGKIPAGGKCERTVFDVSMGRNFYGPGVSALKSRRGCLSHAFKDCSMLISLTDGMYGNFAGRDASRGMAKQSFDDGEAAAN